MESVLYDKSVNVPYSSMGDRSSGVGKDVYAIRWYVIAVVSLANILNNFLWATWGSISQSAYLVYGWTDEKLFWIVNVGNITGFLSVLFGVYLVDCKGIRVSMVVCAATMAVVTAMRIVTLKSEIATILIAIGQGLNGIATSVTMCIPTVVSKTWFKVTERTTATAVSALASALGAAAAYLFGPLTVSMPKLNGTEVLLNETDTSLIKSQMMKLHYISFGFAILLMLCCVIYLPSAPKTAPSKTASIDRYSLKVGIIQLVKNPSVWCIAAVYSIPVGFYGNWSSILDVILSPYGISQADAGWMNFYGSIGGVICGVLLGRCVDHFQKKTKIIIVMLYICAAVDFALFTCTCVDIRPKSKGVFYTTVILGSMIVSSSMPLFLEMTCETSYPVAEGVTAGFLGMIVNLGAAVFMCIELIPNLDTGWANWALVGVYIVAVPLMTFYKAEYKRVDIDIVTDKSIS
ncbi:solute carrier family 49 member 4-like isoform X1 [Mercenaria mercenaria]|uniref:solute carrier family 49 member 4-like isoform X1 n=2 Tax=Mercenaria mercenaria TaxID=6596 RepID=UPI00234F319D|nr:solute carrier family 49 member 4-like isoform X1 [Mercenaria mercenaria]